jgi:hypothetical protein
MGIKRTRLPLMVFAGGIAGLLGGVVPPVVDERLQLAVEHLRQADLEHPGQRADHLRDHHPPVGA